MIIISEFHCVYVGYTSKREAVWNGQVLNNTDIIYPKGVTSATVHLYYNIYGDTSSGDNAVGLLRSAFSNIRYDAGYWNDSIPECGKDID